jgi:Transglutaminase-like superfamily
MVFWRMTLPVLTRALPLERLVRLLARPRTRERPAKQELAVRVAGRLWRSADAPCLQRSLALYRELGRLGANVRLVCGIKNGTDGLLGHTWIENMNRVVLDADDPRAAYATLVEYDRTGERCSAS